MHGQSHDRITVYRPNQRHDLGLLRTWVVMARNIVRSRELIWQLFKRDFFAAYKKSFIGFTWIFISPIIGIASWVFLQYTGLLRTGEVGVPYPAYILVGSSMWGLFMGFYGGARNTLTAGKALVMQVNYPHEALLFKQAATQIANFSLRFGVVLAVLLIFRVPLHWAVLALPLVALPLFLLGSALGLVLSMFSVVAVDVNRMINRALGLMMFASPIVYSLDSIKDPRIRRLIALNPLTHLVCSARDIVLYGRLYDVRGYFICAAASLVLFMISWRLFYISEDKIIERMI